jgi:hypothetical protein
MGSCPVGDEFRAIGEQHGADKTVAIPPFGAAELPQIGSGEGVAFRHDGFPFLLVCEVQLLLHLCPSARPG